MKILLKNHLESAIAALRAHRGRTVLTIIGTTIGIASITMVLSLSSGMSRLFGEYNNSTTTPVAIIKSGGQKTAANVIDDIDDSTITNTLTEKDATDISQIADIKSAPLAFLRTELASRDNKISSQNSALIGTSPSLKQLAGLEVSSGQFIDETSGIVVGNQLSIDLFGTENSIGNIIKVRGKILTVVGVLKTVNNAPDYLNIDFNNAALVSLKTIRQFTQGAAQIQRIAVAADSQEKLSGGLSQAEQMLQGNHNDTDFRILKNSEINESHSALVNLFSIVMTIIGGVSLLVGGIGIMNVMLVNVAERQREVGIRRAVGATGHHIVNQFLIEASIIGLLGGIIGYILGLGGAFVAGLYLPFTPVIYWQTALLVITIATVVGIFAGLYPAARATKRDPIESLRF